MGFDPVWHRRLQSLRQQARLAAQLADSFLARGLPIPAKLQAKLPRAAELLLPHHGSDLPWGVKQFLGMGGNKGWSAQYVVCGKACGWGKNMRLHHLGVLP